MKQFVAAGVHPRTGEPYRWPRKLLPLAALPITTPEKLLVFMEAVLRQLPNATTAALQAASSVDRAKIDQDGLRGDPELLEAALEALPNTVEHFPGRDDMLRMCFACKAAFADDPDRGLEAFDKWCARYDGGGYESGLVRKMWDSGNPPFAFGAPFIYKLAAKLVPDKFNIGNVWFEPIDAAEENRLAALSGLFGESAPKGDEASSGKRTFKLYTAGESARLAMTGRAKPLVERLLDCGALSVIYGAPGVGKSFVMLDMAYRVAAGKPHGDRKVTQGPAVYVAAEGGGAIHARVKALVDTHGEHDGEGFPIPFYILPERVNLRDPRADIGPFLAALQAVERAAGKIVLVVIDTLARSMGGGDENSPVDMGAMVAHFDKIRAFTGAHVAVVHHTGKDAARGMRGHSSLLGAIDTELEVSEGVVKSEKQRDMESGEKFGYRLESVFLGFDDEGNPIKTAIAKIHEIERGGEVQSAKALTPQEMRVRDICFSLEGTFSCRDVCDALEDIEGRPPNKESTRAILNKLQRAGEIDKAHRGYWRRRADKLSETGEVNETP